LSYYHYISHTGLAAIYQTDDYTAKMYSVQTDHLGSITALKCGNFKEYYSYDAWGRRKNVFNHTYNDISFSNITRRGYTGHEHLDNIDIINMNGRCYDPVLGRMLSPDNYIQQPGNSQNYNRYSYCLNNPLKYTDPNGEFFREIFGVIGLVAYIPWFIGSAIPSAIEHGNPFYEADELLTAMAEIGSGIDSMVFPGKPDDTGTTTPAAYDNTHFSTPSISGSITWDGQISLPVERDQMYSEWCLYASAEMIAIYYGEDQFRYSADVYAIRTNGDFRDKGTSMSQFVYDNYEDYGLLGHGGRPATYESMVSALSAGCPILANAETVDANGKIKPGNYHSLVVTGVGTDESGQQLVEYYDPSPRVGGSNTVEFNDFIQKVERLYSIREIKKFY